jgi:hypothetical protein
MNKLQDRTAEIRARLAELAEAAPPLAEILRGTVGSRRVRCGKKGCHCQDGSGHGPVYYLSVSVGGGRTKQIGLSREQYQEASRLAENYAALRDILDEVSRLNRELLEAEARARRTTER